MCAFIAFAVFTQAQQTAVDFALTNPVFQNYTMKNGLSSNYCYDVLQDKKGYLWVATLNGVNRFNANNWRYFQQQSRNSKHRIPSNWVVDISKDPSGKIWMNTVKGIACYNPKTSTITNYPQPVKGWGKICCLSNTVLVVSSWTGIDRYRIQGKRLILQKHYAATENNTILSLFKDRNGTLWACPEDQPSLIRISSDGKACKYIRSIKWKTSSIRPVVCSISDFKTDTLLLSTKKFGLLKYCPKTNTAVSFSKLMPENSTITCTYTYKLSGKSILFIGTANDGLYTYDLSTHALRHYTFDLNNPNGLIANSITAIVGDNNLGIWISTTKGTSYFHPSLQKNKYYFLYHNPIIPDAVSLNAVISIDKSHYLLGTDNNGLFLYHPSSTTTREIPLPEVNPGQITSFLRISDDQILIGSNKGLFVYSVARKTCLLAKVPNLAPNTGILNLKKLENGYTGICTTKGPIVYHFSTKKLLYFIQEKTDRYYCKDLYLHGKHLWSLRFFNGYERIDLRTRRGEDFTPEHLRGKPVNFQNFVPYDKALIIATSEGLIQQNLHSNKPAKLLTSKDGLEGDQIEQIYCVAKSQSLYYTTTTGLFRYLPEKKISQPVTYFENYQQKWYNQLAGTKDGVLLFTVSNYFMVYHPDFAFHNNLHPSNMPEYFAVNGHERKLRHGILQLSNEENNLVFQLAGVVYPQSDKNRWYYRLKGNSDNQFTLVSGDQIHLTNLSRGSYELELYSVNNEGKKSPVVTIARFDIAPPFYATWWFILLLLIGTTGLFYTLYSIKKRQQTKLVEIRNQISRDLHDELGAQVSSISIMSQLLVKDSIQDKVPILQNITQYSSQISNTVNDIIWNINPHTDSVDELIKKMMRFASEVLESAEIDYRVEISPTTLRKNDIDNQVKYHVYLIFKEALNNCVKYSRANLVTISLEQTENALTLLVSDDGIGFNPEEETCGNGLRNMQSRAKEIRASISIHSQIEKGTQIHLKIPLK